MATKKRKKRSLVREGEPSQKTAKGLEIPVPTRREVDEMFAKVIRKRPSGGETTGH